MRENARDAPRFAEYVSCISHKACRLLFLQPMNQPFTNLMARYSGEAEIAKQQEEKAARQEKFRRALVKNCFRVLTVLVIGAGVYFIKPIKTQLDTVTAKVFTNKPTVSAAQQARVSEVNTAALKEGAAVDDAMK